MKLSMPIWALCTGGRPGLESQRRITINCAQRDSMTRSHARSGAQQCASQERRASPKCLATVSGSAAGLLRHVTLLQCRETPPPRPPTLSHSGREFQVSSLGVQVTRRMGMGCRRRWTVVVIWAKRAQECSRLLQFRVIHDAVPSRLL